MVAQPDSGWTSRQARKGPWVGCGVLLGNHSAGLPGRADAGGRELRTAGLDVFLRRPADGGKFHGKAKKKDTHKEENTRVSWSPVVYFHLRAGIFATAAVRGLCGGRHGGRFWALRRAENKENPRASVRFFIRA